MSLLPRKESKTKTAHLVPTENQWVDLFDEYLVNLHSSTFGQAYNIHDSERRRECAQWLAGVASGALRP